MVYSVRVGFNIFTTWLLGKYPFYSQIVRRRKCILYINQSVFSVSVSKLLTKSNFYTFPTLGLGNHLCIEHVVRNRVFAFCLIPMEKVNSSFPWIKLSWKNEFYTKISMVIMTMVLFFMYLHFASK